MFFDRYYDRYYAAKRRKRKNKTIGWIIGIIAFIALVPLAIKSDKKKGEWGIASLLLFVGCKPSKKENGKNDITIAIPGLPYVKSCFKEAAAKCVPGTKKCCAEADAKADAADDEDDDLTDELGEGNDAPEVVLADEQN